MATAMIGVKEQRQLKCDSSSCRSVDCNSFMKTRNDGAAGGVVYFVFLGTKLYYAPSHGDLQPSKPRRRSDPPRIRKTLNFSHTTSRNPYVQAADMTTMWGTGTSYQFGGGTAGHASILHPS